MEKGARLHEQVLGDQEDPYPRPQSPTYTGESRLNGLEARGPEEDGAILCPPLGTTQAEVGSGAGPGLVASGTHSAMVKASSKFFCRCAGLRAL